LLGFSKSRYIWREDPPPQTRIVGHTTMYGTPPIPIVEEIEEESEEESALTPQQKSLKNSPNYNWYITDIDGTILETKRNTKYQYIGPKFMAILECNPYHTMNLDIVALRQKIFELESKLARCDNAISQIR
jgi:hypothetical protein